MDERERDHRFHIESRKVENRFLLARLALRYGCILVAIWFIMAGLIEIAAKAPEQINALSSVVAAMRLYDLLPWSISCITGVALVYERRGKKRAIKKASKLQKLVEANDPNRTSSGLTETGDTPEDCDE